MGSDPVSTSLNISLPPNMKGFVEAQVAAGQFTSASEFVRMLIREYQRREAERRQRHEAWRAEVREQIRVGLAQAKRGELADGEEVFDRLLADLEGPADAERQG